MNNGNEFAFREEYWKRLEEKVGGDAGRELVSGMKELYTLFDSEIIEWFAKLYDPKVGGWYYSNCGRDNEKIYYQGNVYDLLPDLESTAQALRFITQSGLAGQPFKSKACDVLPKWMCERIVRYVKGSQHENGFFYNPQWPKEYTDNKLSRRARDTGNSIAMLHEFGYAPTYDTQTGEKGDYLDVDGNPVAKRAVNEACNEATEAASTFETAPRLASREAFLNYLNTELDIKKGAYSAGNTLTAQMAEIKYRDKVLNEEGADYSLVDTLIEWLNENQNPENGLWNDEANYYGVNGLMKISGCYGKAGRLLPNTDKAIKSALDAICTDEVATSVTSIYNSWFAVERVKRHLRAYGGDEGNRLADEICKQLYANAKEWLIKTKEKFIPFKKPYGSFSYTPSASSARSQGCPVAYQGMHEGDINASIICSSELLYYVYAAFELVDYAVPIFGEAHMAKYRELLNAQYEKAYGVKPE